MSSRLTRSTLGQQGPARSRSGGALGERTLNNVPSRAQRPLSESVEMRKGLKTHPPATKSAGRVLRRSQTDSSAASNDTLNETMMDVVVAGPTEKRLAVMIQLKLREWVKDAVRKKLFITAAFWGEKLLSLSNDPDDCYSLGEIYYTTKQYSRAVTLLLSRCESDLSSRDLVVECLTKLEKFDEAKEIQEQTNLEFEKDPQPLSRASSFQEPTLNKLARSLYLRGRAALTSGDVAAAKKCFEDSLKHDVRCYEVGNMLSFAEEEELLAKLDFDGQLGELADFVRSLYFIRLKKYMKSEELKSAITKLEITYNLIDNPDLLLSLAEFEFIQCRFDKSLELTNRILSVDSLNLNCLWTQHRQSSSPQRTQPPLPPRPRTRRQASSATRLMDGKNRSAEAKRHFSKSTKLDPGCAQAWIGLHYPSLYVGMEHIRMKNLPAAEPYLKAAQRICPYDPLVETELGNYAYYSGQLTEEHFLKAIEVSNENGMEMPMWDTTWNNMGHTCRKLGKFDKAFECYKKVLLMNPRCSSAYATMGIMHHRLGNYNEAIEHYHKALSLNPDDPYCGDLLENALEDSIQKGPRFVFELASEQKHEVQPPLLVEPPAPTASVKSPSPHNEFDDDDEIGRPILPSRSGRLFPSADEVRAAPRESGLFAGFKRGRDEIKEEEGSGENEEEVEVKEEEEEDEEEDMEEDMEVD
ncbi:hypothetical protein BC829DRAFT_440471 [Chytridium lagenaria]|nr:hypothetical protein BC829DRAFT_440471 [Chytridium lagenaria]